MRFRRLCSCGGRPCGMAAAAALLVLLGAAPSSRAIRFERAKKPLAVEVVAAGLSRPAGMAADPKTGDIYVAERGANRISLIHDKEVIPILLDQFQISHLVPPWAITSERTREFWIDPLFREPSGLAFDRDGALYVTEAGRGGRVLRFEPMYDGVLFASIIPTPWLEVAQGYTSVAIDNQDRLFVTAQSSERSVLAFGSVLMRTDRSDWWLVDYGPFAEFSNVAIEPSGETIVVAEHRRADITWYGTERQAEMAAMEMLEGVRHVAFLPDGRTLATLAHEDGTWSLIEVGPLSGGVWEWIGDLGEIGGIHVNPKTQDVYLSLAAEGKILRVRQIEADPEDDAGMDHFAKLTHSFEVDNALPPKEWPAFFRGYIEKLEVIRTVNQQFSLARPTDRSLSRAPMTIGEFASAIPVVAAKIKTRLLSPPESEPDPIEEVSFLLLYPNQSSVTRDSVAPSVSLFYARHKSGKVIRTSFLPNREGKTLSEDMKPEELPDVLVSFPTGYFAPGTDMADEDLVRVYFLGMGLGPDYWIDIFREQAERSRMIVEKVGGEKIEYFVEPYPESVRAGGQAVLVAGIKPVDMGWYRIGAYPVLWQYISEDPRPVFTKHWVDIARLAGVNVRSRASVAAAYSRRLTPEEINLRRRLILRAAARWEEVHF